LASTITLDGQLTDWTNIDRLDFGMTGLNGSKVYGRFVGGTYHFAIESSTVSIGANSTMWLNTDRNEATGYQIWDRHLGAEYKIEFENDEQGGVRAALYSLADGNTTLITDGVSFARSADGKIVELAIDKAKIGDSTAVSTLIDLNDNVFLPGDYTHAPFTLTDVPPPIRADTNLKVAIVFSESSAAKYFSDTAYSQLIMAAQSQAIAAGVPFDILTEADLTNLSKVVNYDAIIFPSFANVAKDKLSAIEDVLADAVNKYGISLVAAGNFMTNDETGAALPDTYARMESLLGVKRVGGNNVDEVTVTASSGQSSHVIGYDSGEQIRTYVKNATSQVGTAYFEGVNGASTQVLATQTASDGTHNAVLATQTGGNNVFFATESMLADSNMLQHAIGWAARSENVPELKLQMGRQASIFAARNDMDQSQEIENVNGGIYTSMLSIVEKWKTDFNFVGSYYVNIGNDAGNGQTTDWTKSKPVYEQLLAMGNEIGTHSYTHPEDTNDPSVDIQFEFEQSKKVLEEKLGIDIKGAAVPGAPESLETSQAIGQYFEYMTGGYTGVGAGYPSAFGYITPNSDSIYLAPNMKFDFSLVDAAPEYGGGLNAEQAKQEWIKEFNELSLKSDMPVFVWPWHDYGPTQWMVNDGQQSRYTEAMYTDFLRYAYEQDTEFVTMLDLAQRIKAFEKAGFNYSFNSATNTMTATVTTDVTANQIGTFALDVEKGKTIASVSGWYAYDSDSVFMDADGGTYEIKLGTPEDVTHITALPSRAQLLSVTGNGINLTFSIEGEGKIAIDLANGRKPLVSGAEIVKLVGDKLELKVSGSGTHTVSVNLDQLAAPVVALKEDTGPSLSDNISSKGELSVTGIAAGATVEYSLDGADWTSSFIPVEGTQTVQVRQKDASGALSEASSLTFTLDGTGPTSTVDMPALDESGMSTVTITFDEVPIGFDPNTDLEVIGGSLDLTPDDSGKVYSGTFKVFSNFEGDASIKLRSDGKYTDLAGNTGTMTPGVIHGVDTKAPTVAAIQFSNTVIRAGTTAAVAIVFSEKVTGFSNADVTVESGSLSTLTTSDGGKTWNAVFTPTHDIEDPANVVKVTGAYTDLAGNAGGNANSGNYAVDTKSPTVSITQTKLGSSNKILATFTFSEAVDPSTFTAQDVIVTGAKMESLAHQGGATYTAILTPLLSSNGQISIGVNNATYADVAGNAGTGAFKAFGATQAKATGGADWLVGTSGKNTLKGGGGDDIIRGGKGNDTISGDGGKDLLDFSDGTKGIKITLSQENTKYATFDGRAAGLGIDKYRDMEGVIGTKFADTITGSSSGDVLAGLGGNDILRGGRGNDVFVFESNGGRDKIMDFEDTGSRHDKLDVSFFDFNVTSNAFAAWKADHVKQQGAHTIVSFDASTSVTLTNIKVKAIGFDDFLF
jgi:Ca2+-binding RTX toxin-like protein/peptidoglycan/xylan/chitin deacetylase (PgdA/CDA1 family)